jgi:peptide/nickel transport system permease protein
MTRFLIRRVVFGAITLWIVLSLVFVLYFVSNPDPARLIAGRAVTPQLLADITHRLNLDQPLIAQYGHFLKSAFTLDLGFSFVHRTNVNELVGRALPVDISLAVGAAVIWLALGIGVGVLAARRPRSLVDRAATFFVLTGISMPTFILGLLFLYVFFYLLTVNHITDFFPPSGSYVPINQDPGLWARVFILPWITLALVTAATYSRLTRSTLLDVLGEDYIRTARAKGLSERRVVYRHALRSALTPIVTQFGIDFAGVLGGVIVTETVFGLPGLGRLVVRGISEEDLPVTEGIIILAAAFLILANILVDALYAVLDPRVRLT